MSSKKNRTGASKDFVTGTWETVGNSWVSNGAPVETDGLLTKAVVTSRNTPYKTYFTLIKGSFDNPQRSATSVAYADSNSNGSLDLKGDLMLGTAVTKSLVDNAGGFSGTFTGSLKSNIVYSLIDGKRVGETTYEKSLWGGRGSKPVRKGKPPKDTTAGQGGNGKQNGATKDPITGQLLTFSDLGTIESDRVYGKEDYRWLQPLVNNGSYTRSEMDQLTEFNVEFEFSPQYIVITVVTKGDTRQNWLATNSSDWIQRVAIKGSFDYSNRKVTRAVIERVAYQQKSQNPEKGGLQIYTPESRLSPNGTPISKTGFIFPPEWTPIIKDTSSWASIYNHVNKGYGIDIDIKDNPYNYSDGGSGPQSSLIKPMVDSSTADGKRIRFQATSFKQPIPKGDRLR